MLLTEKSNQQMINDFNYHYTSELLVSNEKVKMWYVQGDISWKEYQNFILEGE